MPAYHRYNSQTETEFDGAGVFHEDVRRLAAGALGELGDARAVEPLIAALKDESEVVRWSAARTLGELGNARAVEPLKELLGDEDAAVRTAAAEALKRLRGQSEGKP